MKKDELPQDKSALSGYTRELHYVKGNNGKFITGLSSGWEVKASALENAWGNVHEQLDEAKKLVRQGDKSPLYFLMKKNLMDLSILRSYTGYRKFRLRRHFKPSVYEKLSDKTLLKYAEAFSMTLNELKEFEV